MHQQLGVNRNTILMNSHSFLSKHHLHTTGRDPSFPYFKFNCRINAQFVSAQKKQTHTHTGEHLNFMELDAPMQCKIKVKGKQSNLFPLFKGRNHFRISTSTTTTSTTPPLSLTFKHNHHPAMVPPPTTNSTVATCTSISVTQKEKKKGRKKIR